MLYKCGNGRDGYGYPMEKVDWETMGEADQATWVSTNVAKQSNEELVRLGVFHGKLLYFRMNEILVLMALIFFFRLDLLNISDSAGSPRVGLRRGELWSRLAFNISKKPFQLVCELERMSRGKTIILRLFQ